MSAFAEPLAWLMIAGTQIGLYGASALCFYQRSIENVDSTKTQLLWIGISFAVVGLGFSACVICGFKSLKQAIDCIDASADFLARTKRVVFVPVFYFFITTLVCLACAFGFLCVLSLGGVTAGHNQTKKFTLSDDKELQ